MEKEDKHIHIKEAHEKVEAGEPLAAIAVLTQILAQDGNDKEALLLRAEVFQSMGCPKEAEADIDRILPATENPPEEALLRKAALRLAQGDAESAILYYNKVKEQHPRQGNAYIGLSTAYTATHRLDLALAVMDEALKRLPDFSEGYKERGRVRFLLHDQAGAMDDLKKALETSPDTMKALGGKFSNI